MSEAPSTVVHWINLSRSHGLALVPVVAALTYPYWLAAFHAASLSPVKGAYAVAAVCLIAALAVPLIGIWVAVRLARTTPQTRLHIRGKRIAFLSVAAPPLFVLFGVGLGLLGISMRDTTLWILVWMLAGIYVAFGTTTAYSDPGRSLPAVRVLHGAVAVLILCFVAFHLLNHVLGWLGPDTHEAVMAWGRAIYRASWVEPILISLFLLQIGTGGALVWRWSAVATDGYRAFQIASGDYLAIFILAHLNSALISARTLRGIETDWPWASGAPEGLLADAWNIRLLPHYVFGVFFVLAHLVAGLRVVLLAHGLPQQFARHVWLIGLSIAGGVSIAIALALCGARA